MEIISFEKYETPLGGLQSHTVHTSLIGDSSESQFVPFLSGFTGSRIVKDDKSVLLYDLYISSVELRLADERRGSGRTGSNFLKRYDELYYALLTYTVPAWFKTTHKGNDEFIQVAKGMIFDVKNDTEVVLLMIMVIDSEYLWNVNKTNPDYSKFKLLVSDEFMNQTAYNSIFTKLRNEYFPEVVNLGIDVVFTNDIVKYCYKNSFKKPVFGTITDMNNHFDALNKLLYAKR